MNSGWCSYKDEENQAAVETQLSMERNDKNSPSIHEDLAHTVPDKNTRAISTTMTSFALNHDRAMAHQQRKEIMNIDAMAKTQPLPTIETPTSVATDAFAALHDEWDDTASIATDVNVIRLDDIIE